MGKCGLFVVFVFVCLLQLATQAERKTYSALIVDYTPSTTDKNIRRYDSLIQAASKVYHNDIIVFPEGTLSVDSSSLSMVPRGDENVVPYKNETYAKYEVIAAMSRSAAENKMYVVVNLREVEFGTSTGNDSIYNTNVVFDRKGAVIARYRKTHLYNEPGFTRPKPEMVTFKTDFGVTFGIFTCFDINFKSPALDLVHKVKVKDIIFPTYWHNEFPLLSAIQVQSGWSYANNITLLAAGGSNPNVSVGGSGIYQGRMKRQSYLFERPGTILVMSDDIPIGKSRKEKDAMVSGKVFRFKEDPTIPKATYKQLDPKVTVFRDTLCSGSFCCRFNVTYRRSYQPDPKVTYRALAFHGERSFSEDSSGVVEYCAIVACREGNCARKPENGNFQFIFEDTKIEAEFSGGTDSSFQIPTTLVWDEQYDGAILLNTMDYEDFEYEAEIMGNRRKAAMRTTREMNNIVTFGIFGRVFS